MGQAERNVHLYTSDWSNPVIVTNNDVGPIIPGVGVYKFISNAREIISYLKADIKLEPAYPDWIINTDTDRQLKEVITWSVTTRPAQMGGSPDPNRSSGVKEIKPRPRTNISAEDKTYELGGQLFDAFFYFVIWAQTAARAELLTDWFQNVFMANYASLLGSPQVHFYERSQDKELLKLNNLLQTRTLVYYAQLAENYAIEKHNIQRDNLKTKL